MRVDEIMRLIDLVAEEAGADLFTASSVYIPEPQSAEIKAEPRGWASAKYVPSRPSMREPEFASQIYGQRSDGRMFYTNVTFYADRCRQLGPEELVSYVAGRFRLAIEKFNSYRDCSCGIVGYKDSGEVDEDGDKIMAAVHSPCETHPKAQLVL